MAKGKYHRKRENAERKARQEAQRASANVQAAKREEEMSEKLRSENTPGKHGGSRWLAGTAVAISTIVGIAAGVFSFFPHVTISDPAQMDPTDLFSYQINVTNDGVLPIFGARWAFAPICLRVLDAQSGAENTGTHPRMFRYLFPHYGAYVVTANLMNSVTRPGPERHAAIMMNPGSELIVDDGLDGEFHIMPENNSIGRLSPGDQVTVTTEGIISAQPGVSYGAVDFAIAITYIPVFPPIPMQTCSHFYIHKDRQGTPRWFRAPNKCDRFPWMHNWFDGSPASSGQAN